MCCMRAREPRPVGMARRQCMCTHRRYAHMRVLRQSRMWHRMCGVLSGIMTMLCAHLSVDSLGCAWSLSWDCKHTFVLACRPSSVFHHHPSPMHFMFKISHLCEVAWATLLSDLAFCINTTRDVHAAHWAWTSHCTHVLCHPPAGPPAHHYGQKRRHGALGAGGA